MRFSKSLFVAFAGLGLFACSNEDVTNGTSFDDGKTKSMVIALNGVNKAGRAIEEAKQAGTVNLTKVAIYYADEQGNVGHVTTLSSSDQVAWAALTGDGYVEHELPASITKVHVVGNYSDKALGNPNSFGTIALVKEKVIEVAHQQNFNDVLLWGEDTDGLKPVNEGDGVEGHDKVVKAELNIAPLVSRLEVSNIQCEDLGNQYSSIALKKIGLNNFYTSTTIDGTNSEPTKFTTAEDWTDPAWSFNEIENGTLNNNTVWNPTITGSSNGVFAYHIVPNKQANPLEVRLQVDAKRTATVDPFSNTVIAKINKDLEPGKIYQISYKFKEENIGPWDPTNVQCVIVDVTVANWTIETITPDFEK